MFEPNHAINNRREHIQKFTDTLKPQIEILNKHQIEMMIRNHWDFKLASDLKLNDDYSLASDITLYTCVHAVQTQYMVSQLFWEYK